MNRICVLTLFACAVGCGRKETVDFDTDEYKTVQVISKKSGQVVNIAGYTMLGGKATVDGNSLHYRGPYVCRWEGCEVSLLINGEECDRMPIKMHLDPDEFAVFELECHELPQGEHEFTIRVMHPEGRRLGNLTRKFTIE